MRRIEARRKNAKALRVRFSKSLANRRHRLSQAKVRSTTQRRGRTSKPFGVIRALDDFDWPKPFERPALDIHHRRGAFSRRETSRTGSREQACLRRGLEYRPDVRSHEAPRAQRVHDPIHDFAHIDLALAATMFGRRNQRCDVRPFLASQVARIPEFVTIVFRAVCGRPHPAAPPRIRPPPLNHNRFIRFNFFSDGH